MSHFLLPSTPIYGHVAPMVGIGRGLRERGHRVSVLTGSKFRAAVEAAGLGFLPLPAEADYDDAELDAWLPGRDRYRGLAAGRYSVIGLFVLPSVPAARRRSPPSRNAAGWGSLPVVIRMVASPDADPAAK